MDQVAALVFSCGQASQTQVTRAERVCEPVVFETSSGLDRGPEAHKCAHAYADQPSALRQGLIDLIC